MTFGIANNVKSQVVQVCTPELLRQAIDSPHVAQVCAELRDALERKMRGEITPQEYEDIKCSMKKQLPILTPHATFRNGRRKNEDAIPSGLSIYDLDHIPNPEGRWEEIAPRKEELGIVMAHVTPSTEGLRLVFIIPHGMTLAQAQAWMAQQLGDTHYDQCVKDHARCSFLVPREYVLFMDEEGLFREGESTQTENCSSTASGESHTPSPLRGTTPNLGVESVTTGSSHYPSTYQTIPYPLILEVLEEQMGGRPEHGSRNNFIFSMACHLRYICDDDPEWIAKVLPTYGESRDKWMATIRSACNRNQTKRMPRIMERTLEVCKSRLGMKEEQEEVAEQDADTPPPMPKNLPPLIKLLISRTPDIYKPAVAHAVFPALATHLWQTRFRYIDNVEHEATLMNVLMAGTGAGKNCISEPINRIMADIRLRDQENLRREREWKKEVQSKGANKDKRQRPEGLVIQEIDPDMTNAAFVQRLADAENRFLYTKMNEIDQFDSLKGGGRGKAQFQIMCLAFDPNNIYGQTRVGTSSVSERVCIRFNWNASTTAVAHAVFPALATHLWQTRFRYIDNVEHEATLMNVLMAGTGAGKNCISEPINRIMADIRHRDQENLRREREWKHEVQSKGANKDKRQRPEGLVIQEIDPDMTNAAFVQLLADAGDRFLYTKMNEIDQFDALKSSSNRKGQFQIMCLAFDPGNVYGQTRVGTSSVSERVCIRFNWNASTTILKGQRYFSQVLTDGPISRINFCTIPEREIGAEMPMYGTYDEAFDEELRPYIERLNNARGLVDCPQARALAKKLIEECADFSRLSQSRVYENLSYRANVIAYLKAMVLYVAQGERWDKRIEDFIRWSLHYDLWCKMEFFGESIEDTENNRVVSRRGPQNLLDLLPDIFTREEAQMLRQRMGIRTSSVAHMISTWKTRGYIRIHNPENIVKDLNRQEYVKTSKYLKGEKTVS